MGKDNNTPMKSVTGGSFPARVWRTFMLGALPKLKVTNIPGGVPYAEPPSSDLIGDILMAPSGNPELPAPSAPPQPPAQPAGKQQAGPEFF